jgi:hypothetical protein
MGLVDVGGIGDHCGFINGVDFAIFLNVKE